MAPKAIQSLRLNSRTRVQNQNAVQKSVEEKFQLHFHTRVERDLVMNRTFGAFPTEKNTLFSRAPIPITVLEARVQLFTARGTYIQ